jgi:Family of unknown function (DUF5662)
MCDTNLKLSNLETLQHITQVRNMLNKIIVELIVRAENHDQSKLVEPELSTFSKKINTLTSMQYGSDAYEQNRQTIMPALTHHYENNRHHPEHFENGIDGMNIVDLIEMLCDWKASSMRHEGGSFMESVAISGKRFNVSEQLLSIVKNTEQLLC